MLKKTKQKHPEYNTLRKILSLRLLNQSSKLIHKQQFYYEIYLEYRLKCQSLLLRSFYKHPPRDSNFGGS